MKKTFIRWMLAGVAASACQAQAATLSESESGSLNLDIEAMAGVFSASEDYIGGDGQIWQEGYGKATLSGTHALGADMSVYGGLGGIVSGTFGDGDAAGFTTGDERELDLENAYIGLKSGDGLLDVSVGRQSFQLGDGFLIAGDAISLGEGLDPAGVDVDRGGAYYLAGRRSFANTAILRLDPKGPVRGDLFWLESNNPYQQDTELGGGNLELVDDGLGTLGLSYLKILDVDAGANLALWDQREGMDVVSLRGQGNFGVEDLFVSFEYVDQSGGDTDVKNDANAWYVEAGWTFSGLRWSPGVNARYSSFSGDDSATTDNEAFDPLFFGFTRGYGTWFQGEVASNYAGPANSGNDAARVELTLAPRSDLVLGAQYWDFGSNDDAPNLDGRELDVYALWTVNENFVVSPLIGFYEPEGFDVTESQGNDDTNLYAQAVLMYFY